MWQFGLNMVVRQVTRALEASGVVIVPRWVKVKTLESGRGAWSELDTDTGIVAVDRDANSGQFETLRVHLSFGPAALSCGGKGGGIDWSEAMFRLRVQAAQESSPLRSGEVGNKIRLVEILRDVPKTWLSNMRLQGGYHEQERCTNHEIWGTSRKDRCVRIARERENERSAPKNGTIEESERDSKMAVTWTHPSPHKFSILQVGGIPQLHHVNLPPASRPSSPCPSEPRSLQHGGKIVERQPAKFTSRMTQHAADQEPGIDEAATTRECGLIALLAPLRLPEQSPDVPQQLQLDQQAMASVVSQSPLTVREGGHEYEEETSGERQIVLEGEGKGMREWERETQTQTQRQGSSGQAEDKVRQEVEKHQKDTGRSERDSLDADPERQRGGGREGGGGGMDTELGTGRQRQRAKDVLDVLTQERARARDVLMKSRRKKLRICCLSAALMRCRCLFFHFRSAHSK